MAQNLNMVALSGNLTREPEIRKTASDKDVLSFSLACNDRRKTKDGEWGDYANFVDVTYFGANAKALGGILDKGSFVALTGKLRHSTWEKDGQKRSKLEVIADNINLPPKKSNQTEMVFDE